jgi:hypothetical protein
VVGALSCRRGRRERRRQDRPEEVGRKASASCATPGLVTCLLSSTSSSDNSDGRESVDRHPHPRRARTRRVPAAAAYPPEPSLTATCRTPAQASAPRHTRSRPPSPRPPAPTSGQAPPLPSATLMAYPAREPSPPPPTPEEDDAEGRRLVADARLAFPAQLVRTRVLQLAPSSDSARDGSGRGCARADLAVGYACPRDRPRVRGRRRCWRQSRAP